MPISTEMKIRVAHADIVMDMAFAKTLWGWQSSSEDCISKALPGDCGAILLGEGDGVVIEGNCSQGASMPEGGTIHINGDLTSHLDAGGFTEVVITGDLKQEASIEADGFFHLFVGGKLSGIVRCTDGAKIWVESDLDGTVQTGTPRTGIHIGGDYLGEIMPYQRGALLYISVAGFARHVLMERIAENEYTQFNASIARSDVPPGIYPLDGVHRKTPQGSKLNRWCVQACEVF